MLVWLTYQRPTWTKQAKSKIIENVTYTLVYQLFVCMFNPQVMHYLPNIIDPLCTALNIWKIMILSKCQFLISNSKPPHIWIKRIWAFIILLARFLVFYLLLLGYSVFFICCIFLWYLNIFMEYSINTMAYVLYFIWCAFPRYFRSYPFFAISVIPTLFSASFYWWVFLKNWNSYAVIWWIVVDNWKLTYILIRGSG